MTHSASSTIQQSASAISGGPARHGEQGCGIQQIIVEIEVVGANRVRVLAGLCELRGIQWKAGRAVVVRLG
ncbi:MULTISPECIES: hypothetical protein [unclassified Bradyrhizobium]|uniref:hypothetical protein n=1 Tax=unclassified Bradyrhizobium TaxID=2631580 RepID=UPI00048DA611|nr:MULTISPECIES: hypothetical protein [unclassified Bradyrhizobium]QIG92434.1 hypothetical protein G6P99_07890 [Bradyrhizobium sp. 6(2017)]